MATYMKGCDIMSQGKFKLLGYPLSHSLSPFIHERLFQLSKRNSIYDLYSISQQDFDANIDSLLQEDGFNVTIPYKMKIMQYLDELDERARLYNAVNTVDCKGKVVGYNTDYYGFLHGLNDLGVRLKDGPVLLLGAGGAAHMIAAECILAGASLTIAVREQSLLKGARMRDFLMNINASSHIQVVDIQKITGHFHLLVNATPVGLYPHINECPVSEEVVMNCDYVYDLIYNPVETKLIQIAREHQIPANNGVSMLVWQAVYAHKIWYQAEFDEEDIHILIEDTQKAIETDFSVQLSARQTQI